MDQFNGRHFTDEDAPPLSLGVVRGARSFGIDTLGRLTGVRYVKVWTPGENLAVCLKEPYPDAWGVLPPVFTDFNGNPVPAPPGATRWENRKKPADHKQPEHHMAKCKCGFYAYYEGSNDYASGNTISGVVEGYGECMVGTRGFRAAKARIIALSKPNDFYFHQRVVDRIRRNYKGIPFFDTFKEMIAEFPPDQTLELSPENDEHFWERKI